MKYIKTGLLDIKNHLFLQKYTLPPHKKLPTSHINIYKKKSSIFGKNRDTCSDLEQTSSQNWSDLFLYLAGLPAQLRKVIGQSFPRIRTFLLSLIWSGLSLTFCQEVLDEQRKMFSQKFIDYFTTLKSWISVQEILRMKAGFPVSLDSVNRILNMYC